MSAKDQLVLDAVRRAISNTALSNGVVGQANAIAAVESQMRDNLPALVLHELKTAGILKY